MSNSSEVEDAEASYFAICLLMPRPFVEREVRAMGGIDVADDRAMKKLADKFKVSPTLMAFRIGQLSAH